MNRFTIFTIILSVSVITVFADLLVRESLHGQGLASVLTVNSDGTTANSEEEVSPVLQDPTVETTEPVADDSTLTTDDQETKTVTDSSTSAATTATTVENPKTPATQVASFVTQSLVKTAGFTGTLDEKQFPGKLYQLLDITSFPVSEINNYMITESSVSAASVTEIVLPDEIQALQLYLLLQNKTKPYIDLTLNETNAYGDRSFYINHVKKPNEAFLTVKIKNRIYGFAYVKFYHPELKKLITLLTEAK